MSSIDEIILNSKSNDEYIKKLMGSLIMCTKCSNSVPGKSGANEFTYIKKNNTQFSEFIDASVEKSEGVILDLLEFITPNQGNSFPEDIDFSDKNRVILDKVVDTIDFLLARADLRMDQLLGENAKMNNLVLGNRMEIMINQALDIPKPQLTYGIAIDNSREKLFRPLRNKENVKVNRSEDANISAKMYNNPFEAEIMSTLSSRVFDARAGQLSSTGIDKTWLRTLKETIESAETEHFVFVQDSNGLDVLIKELEEVTEIAIDLEHHSLRSFQGITCLMQISTRQKDYIIDTLPLWKQMNKLLPVFSNPNIVKIFHGCEADNAWLQRDFGLYIVNCFDTYQASKFLKLPAFSLAHLLQYYCNVNVDKKHQLSDWRKRPLPSDMVKYARSDTHFLIFIYDCMVLDVSRNGGSEGLLEVRKNTNNVLLQAYTKPVFDANGYLREVNNVKKVVGSSRIGSVEIPDSLSDYHSDILRLLWDWRDITARVADESLIYVATMSDLLKLAIVCPQTETQARNLGLHSKFLKNDFNSSGQSRLSEVCAIIERATKGGVRGLVDKLDQECDLENGIVTTRSVRMSQRIEEYKKVVSLGLFVPRLTGNSVTFSASGAKISLVNCVWKEKPQNTKFRLECDKNDQFILDIFGEVDTNATIANAVAIPNATASDEAELPEVNSAVTPQVMSISSLAEKYGLSQRGPAEVGSKKDMKKRKQVVDTPGFVYPEVSISYGGDVKQKSKKAKSNLSNPYFL